MNSNEPDHLRPQYMENDGISLLLKPAEEIPRTCSSDIPENPANSANHANKIPADDEVCKKTSTNKAKRRRYTRREDMERASRRSHLVWLRSPFKFMPDKIDRLTLLMGEVSKSHYLTMSRFDTLENHFEIFRMALLKILNGDIPQYPDMKLKTPFSKFDTPRDQDLSNTTAPPKSLSSKALSAFASTDNSSPGLTSGKVKAVEPNQSYTDFLSSKIKNFLRRYSRDSSPDIKTDVSETRPVACDRKVDFLVFMLTQSAVISNKQFPKSKVVAFEDMPFYRRTGGDVGQFLDLVASLGYADVLAEIFSSRNKREFEEIREEFRGRQHLTIPFIFKAIFYPYRIMQVAPRKVSLDDAPRALATMMTLQRNLTGEDFDLFCSLLPGDGKGDVIRQLQCCANIGRSGPFEAIVASKLRGLALSIVGDGYLFRDCPRCGTTRICACVGLDSSAADT